MVWHRAYDIVTGADTKRIRSLRHNQIKTYGAGRHSDKNHWRGLVDELLAQDIIRQEGDRYPVLKLTTKGSDVLFGKARLTGLKREEARAVRESAGLERYDKILFEKLRVIRKGIAEEEHVPPFVIFSDKTLHEMCRYYPVSLPEMGKISGVGKVKLERYAAAFLAGIKKHLDEHPEISKTNTSSLAPGPIEVKRRQDKKPSQTIEETYALFKKGLCLEDVAGLRGLAPSTIAGHLERLIREGRDIDVGCLIDPVKRDKIEKLFLSSRQWTLSPVVENSAGEVTYEEARIVRAFLLNKTDAPPH